MDSIVSISLRTLRDGNSREDKTDHSLSYIFSALDVILRTLPWNPAEEKGGELTSEALGGDLAAGSVSVSCLLSQS